MPTFSRNLQEFRTDNVSVLDFSTDKVSVLDFRTDKVSVLEFRMDIMSFLNFCTHFVRCEKLWRRLRAKVTELVYGVFFRMVLLDFLGSSLSFSLQDIAFSKQ